MTEKGLLRQQRVIQAFGVMMLLSPFVNVFLSIYPVKNPHKWTWPVLKLLLNDISTVHWILWTCSVIIGLLMLKGKRDSWISVLGLLSLFIFYNLITLKAEMQKTGILPVFLLLCNIVVFVVVYMAEFSKPVTRKIKNLVPKGGGGPLKATAQTESVANDLLPAAETVGSPSSVSNQAMASVNEYAESIRRQNQNAQNALFDLNKLLNVTVEFEGLGPWAKITAVQGSILVFKCLQEPPEGVQDRAVEILVGNLGLILSFASRKDSEIRFKCHEVVWYSQTNAA
jgi:hypothetical protein